MELKGERKTKRPEMCRIIAWKITQISIEYCAAAYLVAEIVSKTQFIISLWREHYSTYSTRAY